ncbi:undecaprenyl-diphosphatase [Paenibacillus thiaminolyticus]|uniref:undecaprenyl-diphosphatase n=1 Tax=Paenibacillus thiaminolyticus TaxID=49283 RepID=UPI001162528F|nr:undecaprenyl-diphosphatase [Paenibacillus thiaminolyticus]NGP59335.1 undecaprenyl-diphosphatase [Paenibacillus thiaminolyticus]WCR29913.1 undecaprenyl-diphosphatase [Paenibacillus thiaminolyticus]
MIMSQWNIDIFRAINDLGKQFASLNPAAVFVAEYMVYALALAMLVYWFTRSGRNRMMVIQAGLAFILAEIMGKAASKLYSHHQPFAELPEVNKLIDHAIDNSFPSDHTILFFSVCVSFWLVRKKEGWLWLALACCVAVSRIWVGVHYPVDIAAGALLGMVSALVMYWLVPKLGFVKRSLDLYERAERRILPMNNKSDSL